MRTATYEIKQGSTLRPVGSPMRPASTQWRLHFHAWSPTWSAREVTFFLRKRTLMIIYPLQKQRIANGFANALTFCPNALKVCLNVLTICLNALTISSNTLTDCSYDLTVGPSNV